MPEHTSFFTYLLAAIPAFRDAAKAMGHTLFGKDVTTHTLEALVAAAFVALVIIGLAFVTRGKIQNTEEAVIPEDKLTLRTFMEFFIEYVYDDMKGIMGARRAKQYFPVIGTAGLFVFFSNMLGLIPGFAPPTSSWDVTLGCALVVFVAFNYYGLKENGIGYIKHLAGPVWWLAWLILPLETVSLLIRPLTLSVRLMLNMSVDHLLSGIVHGLFMYLLPVVVMLLGTLIVIVQTLVFVLLSGVYIGLATEHEDHGEGHAHGHDKKGKGHDAHEDHGEHAHA